MFDFFEEIGLCYVEVFLSQETVGRSQSSTLLEFRRRVAPLGAALPRRKSNARVVVPLLIGAHFAFCMSIPRVSFWALPSFHPGLCRSVVPTALVRQRFSLF